MSMSNLMRGQAVPGKCPGGQLYYYALTAKTAFLLVAPSKYVKIISKLNDFRLFLREKKQSTRFLGDI